MYKSIKPPVKSWLWQFWTQQLDTTTGLERDSFLISNAQPTVKMILGGNRIHQIAGKRKKKRRKEKGLRLKERKTRILIIRVGKKKVGKKRRGRERQRERMKEE